MVLAAFAKTHSSRMHGTMVKLGNLFSRWRTGLMPVFYGLMFLPGPRTFPDWRLAVAVGLAVTVLGELVRITTIGFDYLSRDGRGARVYAEGLVTTGVFAHSRNPLYVGNVLLLLGMGVLSNSLAYLLVMVPAFVFVYACIIRAEERPLRAKFGVGFEAYAHAVPRWWPRMEGLHETLGSGGFNARRVLIEEYDTTALWLTAAVLLTLTHTYRAGGERALEPVIAWYALALLVIAAAYLTIRYLKKSGRVRA